MLSIRTLRRLPEWVRRSFLIFLPLLGISCAGQYAPPGGPRDTVPPEILAIYPAPGTIHFRGLSIDIAFSEYVDRRKVEEAVFFSPSIGRRKFNWGGKEVSIEFGDSLRPNTTYIMSLGTDVTDLRGNRMAKTFFLPFSTGDKIDSASFAGRVYDPSPAGVTIFAYKLDGINPDTLDPTKTRPDFLTQTSLDGTFLLPYLSNGHYRLCAVRDEYKNFLYDRQVDDFGVLPRDLELVSDSARVGGLQFMVAKEDTAPPFVTAVKSLDSSRLQLRFSEVIEPSTLKLQYIKITDTLTQSELPLRDVSVVGDSAIAAELIVDSLRNERGYRIRLANVQDLHGNAITVQPKGLTFGTLFEDDTLKPTVAVLSPPNNGLAFPTDTIVMHANRGIDRGMFEATFALLDSAKRRLDGKFMWEGSAWVRFVPLGPLPFGSSFTIRYKLDSVRSLSGTFRNKDSLVSLQFQTYASTQLGSISGNVVRDSGGTRGKVYVRLQPVSAFGARVRQVAAYSTGDFAFPNLIEGTYQLSAFRDQDGDGVFTYGNVKPFTPSEHFAPPGDTLKVRARWPLENVILRIR